MSTLTSNIDAEKQSILISIEKRTQIPCFVKKGQELTIQFLSASENGDDPFTLANEKEKVAVTAMIENGELFQSPLSVQHFDKTYWMLTPPMR